jgi:xylose isomerase
VWESAKANMRMYLLLKERAQAFRADPEVQEALRASKVLELETPTLNPGETYQDLLNDKSAFEEYDVDTAGAQGYGFVKLHQLAIDHVLRAR